MQYYRCAVMTHGDEEWDMKLALSLYIPFWLWLPKVSPYEDVCGQGSLNFLGIAVDFDKGR